MNDFLINLEFFKYSIACLVLMALVCSFLSVYIVLKRIVFVSVAVTQISAAGIAIAFIAGLNPTLISLLFTFLGVAIFSIRFTERRLSNESRIGIAFVVSSAAAILLVSKSARGIHEIDDLLYGNILAANPFSLVYLLYIFSFTKSLRQLLLTLKWQGHPVSRRDSGSLCFILRLAPPYLSV